VDGNEATPGPRRAGAGAPRDELQGSARVGAPTDAPPAGDEPSAGDAPADERSGGEPSADDPILSEPSGDDPTPSDSTTDDDSPSDSTADDDSSPSDSTTDDDSSPSNSTADDDSSPSDSTTDDDSSPSDSTADDDSSPSDSTADDDSSPSNSTADDDSSPSNSTADDDSSPSNSTAEAAPIFDLPDHGADGEADDKASGNGDTVQRPGNGNRTLVLGGAAAAEGRTTGPNPRIAGPLPAESRHAAGGNGRAGVEEEEVPTGRHFRVSPSTDGRDGGPPRWALALAALPVFVLVLLLVAWAIDTAALSGQVRRNVEVAGRPVGGLGEASLPEVMNSIAEEVAARPLRITSDDKVYETTAGEIGLALDEQATSEAALDVGRDDHLFMQPFSWLRSFVTPREVDVRYTVSGPTATAKIVELQGADRTAPRNPTIMLGQEGWTVVPGTPGQGLDTETLIDVLPDAAAESRTGAIEVAGGSAPVAPTFTDAQAQEQADRANQMTANGLQLTAAGTTKTVPAAQLRTWIGPTAEGGELGLAINKAAVDKALPGVFADIIAPAQNARIVLGANSPTVVPSQQGVSCCGADSAGRVWKALSEGQPGAELEATTTEPALTTEAAQGLGVARPVCGNNAWQNGVATTAGPGFTTYYNPGEPRVTNIHRIADIVDGTLVLPGQEFSMNDVVGQRTLENGFVVAGAIRDGKHVDEVGGGVSQFATTTFNAAYFCGLDITAYQAHSEYFTRYPRGREATMGYPAPNLSFVNDTPYGILIDTSYTDTSVTVTMWSSPYARGEQVGSSESKSGACDVVTTTRRITYPDKPPATDTFTATYRPGPDQTC
jgi:vancomycin resistance protein YoaR